MGEEKSLSSFLTLSLPIRPDGKWMIGVRRDGYRQRWLEVPGDGSESAVDCELLAITGDATMRVVDAEGNGIGRATVVVSPPGDPFGRQYGNWTDAEGYFEVPHVTSRPMDIFVWSRQGHASAARLSVDPDKIDGLVVDLGPPKETHIPHATDPPQTWGVRCEDSEGRTVFDDAWAGIARHGPSTKFTEAPPQATTIVVYDRVNGEVVNRFPIDP